MKCEQAHPPFDNAALTVAVQDRAPVDSDELVIAWARDRETGALLYILELGPDQRGARSGCDCISCSSPLTAVNAAKAEYKRRPHFRHPIGAPKLACLVLAAREALRQAFQPGEVIVLPRRRRSAQVEGLSGELYEAWVEQPTERVRISSVQFKDGIRALLVLDDGRELEVHLVGSADASETALTGITPRILIVVDDPSIAGMSPNELRQRLIPLLNQSTWCGHWRDAVLDEQAQEAALGAADTALDWDAKFADLPPDLRRESLLHREVKAILEHARWLRLPGWTVQDDGNHQYGGTRHASTSPTTVTVKAARLERRLGRIIPDVIAQLADGSELLIEVTVTNHVTPERLVRIREVNLPTLEIDVSRMGGRITRSQLAILVTEEVAGKTWLHHPEMVAQREALITERREESRNRAVREAERREILSVPLDEWAERYLAAIVRHADLRFQEMSPDNGAHEYDITQAREVIEECGRALHEFGYPEARDERLYDFGHTVVERLLSIKLDTGVGYQLDTGWQVINAILQDRSDASKSWHTLYLMAIKVFQLRTTVSQKKRLDEWRSDVARSIRAGEDTCRRDPKYDDFFAVLFPDMREALVSSFGRRDLPANRTPMRRQISQIRQAVPPEEAPTVRAASTSPGADYFDGAREQRWLWTQPSPELAKRAKVQREQLLKSGYGGAASNILHSLLVTTVLSDPWTFAVAMQRDFGIGKSVTLRFLFSSGLIAPMTG